MSRACNAAISVLPRRLPLGGRLWLDFRAPERPRSRSLKHASRACNAAISVLPVFTRAPARVNTFGPANLWHGAGTRGGLRPRFGGAGGGAHFRDPFFDHKSAADPPSQHCACWGGRRGFLVKRWSFFCCRVPPRLEGPEVFSFRLRA